MKKTLTALALCSFIGFAGQAQALSFTTYTDILSWQAAFAPVTSIWEGFDDPTLLPGFSITETGGGGAIEFSHYENWVDAESTRYQSFNYAPGMTAFGGYFDLATPGGEGSSIDMWVGATNVMNIPNSTNGQFYGFVADGIFNTVTFKEGNDPEGWRETYYAVDIHLAPVPEPTTMLLFGAGLAGLAGARRKMKK